MFKNKFVWDFRHHHSSSSEMFRFNSKYKNIYRPSVPMDKANRWKPIRPNFLQASGSIDFLICLPVRYESGSFSYSKYSMYFFCKNSLFSLVVSMIYYHIIICDFILNLEKLWSWPIKLRNWCRLTSWLEVSLNLFVLKFEI